MFKKTKMTTITISIPDKLKEDMDKLPEVNWSACAREIISKKIEQLEKFEQLVKEGKI